MGGWAGHSCLLEAAGLRLPLTGFDKASFYCLPFFPAPPAPPRVYNMGGPDRLSRLDMARAVAAARGRDPAAILAAAALPITYPSKHPFR